MRLLLPCTVTWIAALATTASATSWVTAPYVERVPGTLDQSEALLDATWDGPLDEVEALIAAGADVNAWTTSGRTPMQNAIRRGDVEMVELLVRSGAIVTHRPYGERGSVLHDAARYGRASMVQLLIRAGADVNQEDRYRNTPLHVATRYAKGTECVGALLRHGADVHAENRSGRTPLEHADIATVDVEVVRALIDAGSRPVRARSGRPAHHALEQALYSREQSDVARLLLELGCARPPEYERAGIDYCLALLEGDDAAAVRALEVEGGSGEDARARMAFQLYLAARHGRSRVVKTLLDSGAPRYWSRRDAQGVAVYYGHPETVRRFIDRGLGSSGSAEYLLGIAVRQGHRETAADLLAARANVDGRWGRGPRRGGSSLLRVAAGAGDVEMVKLLLEHGARVDWADPDDKETPLHAGNRSLEVWRVLLESGADSTAEDARGRTPLWDASDEVLLAILNGQVGPTLDETGRRLVFHSALASRYSAVVDAVLYAGLDVDISSTDVVRGLGHARSDMLSVFLDHGVDVRGPFGTLLAGCCGRGDDALVRRFLTLGADPNVPDDRGVSPLEAALRGGHRWIARRLVDHGAVLPGENGPRRIAFSLAVLEGRDEFAIAALDDLDPNQPIFGNIPPLAMAIRLGAVDVAGAAIERGADLELRDARKRTPLERAIETRRLAMIQLLLDAGADPDAGTRLPMRRAVDHASLELVTMLLDAGVTRGLESALSVARLKHMPEIVTKLEAAIR